MQIIIGQVLLWSGFLVAAFTTVMRQEVEESPWQTIHWGGYLGAVSIGIVGIVLLRMGNKSAAEDSSRVDAEFSTLTDAMQALLTAVSNLRNDAENLHPQAIVKRIDDECAEPFSQFADSRNALVQRFGLQGFADVMTQFASAERFVNRAWSAAADGYLDEAVASLNRADQHLQQANEKILSNSA